LVEETILAKAASNTTSLRTTVPASMVRQFNLSDGDRLGWDLKVENGEMIIVVKPIRHKEEK
jgi:antitoxin component of MazEF toxin-antitoxin module